MKFILVSHGSFAKGLVESSQMIMGPQENLVAFGLYPEDDISTLKEKIEEELTNSEKEDVVFFSDLFHGSPFNVVVSLTAEYDVYHLTGMNMPLMLEALMARHNPQLNREQLCKLLLENSKQSIIDVRESLKEV